MIPLLIAGHGTADTEGAEQFRRFVKRVGTRVEVPVAGGFIELSAPPLAEAVSALVDGGGRRLAAVRLGFDRVDGPHARYRCSNRPNRQRSTAPPQASTNAPTMTYPSTSNRSASPAYPASGPPTPVTWTVRSAR